MKIKINLIGAAVALSLGACAPVVQGGPPVPVFPGLQETAQVGAI